MGDTRYLALVPIAASAMPHVMIRIMTLSLCQSKGYTHVPARRPLPHTHTHIPLNKHTRSVKVLGMSGWGGSIAPHMQLAAVAALAQRQEEKRRCSLAAAA